jgi:adenosine deaminase
VSSVDNRDHRDERIVVGIGLGGPERPDRAPFFATALARFRALGLGLDVHSGEQAHVTAAAHAATVEALRPERVGHGFRGAAAGYFFGGALAACPLSNVLLGCHDGPLATHPIAEMLRRGLDVSINTDDPLLFGTNLVIEYVALRRAFGLDRDAFARTQANARRQLLAPAA